jgi:CRP-like cAMP-binding protein
MAIIDERREQMFPVFTPAEIESIRRFGSPVRFAAGARVVATGEPIPGMHVILAGRVAILQRHPFIDETPVIEHGPGEFIAEIASLTGRSALIDARAMTDVEALLVSPEQLRALLIADAELGERIMRADPAAGVADRGRYRRPDPDRTRGASRRHALAELSDAQRLSAPGTRSRTGSGRRGLA